ncbi:MAG: hypothetical protein BMS9Abin05_2035 [Rhodothermia bacterium]|nr:MAG: hypothetical protein BMS9Abin05_2035 [Rhodothermia bacterium]
MRYISIVLLLVLNGLAGCLISDVDETTETWMSIAPIQCLGNPWELDWLASHDNDYESYPADPSTPELEFGEKAIILDYYARQGVRIKELKSKQWDGAVCLACSCPAGYTLFALVDDVDLDRMCELGFDLTEPHD